MGWKNWWLSERNQITITEAGWKMMIITHSWLEYMFGWLWEFGFMSTERNNGFHVIYKKEMMIQHKFLILHRKWNSQGARSEVIMLFQSSKNYYIRKPLYYYWNDSFKVCFILTSGLLVYRKGMKSKGITWEQTCILVTSNRQFTQGFIHWYPGKTGQQSNTQSYKYGKYKQHRSLS